MDFPGPGYDDRPQITIEEGDHLASGKKRQTSFDGFYKAVSSVFLVGTVLLILFFAYLMLNPYTSLNPLPPPTPLPTPTLFVLPQAVAGDERAGTATPIGLTPTITASPQPTATYTPTPQAPDNLQVTLAPNEMPFILLGEEVVFSRNETEEGCEGIWVAGRIFDLDGAPIAGIPLLVTGEGFQELQISGSWPEFGLSGYRVKIANRPLRQKFEIVLIDPTTGQNISRSIEFESETTCDANLILIDFIQASEYQF